MTEHLSLLLYTEIDVTCILLLIYIIYKSFGYVERRQSWNLFQMSMVFITLFITADFLWMLAENTSFSMPRSVAYLLNSLYFLFVILGTGFWFFYAESELETDFFRKKAFFAFSLFPIVLTVLLLVLNLFNGWLFYLDEQNTYHRGPLNILAFIIPCFYLFFSVFHSLLLAFQKENFAKKKSYLNLTGFTMTTVIPCLLHVFLPGTPLTCIGLSLAALLVYVNAQEMLVSADPLTKLNNRYHMIQFLSLKMEHRNPERPLYLLLIDLDYFKHINDTYGHVEGDNALILLANILRQTASRFNCFVSRYGGDEFILICESASEDIPEQIRAFISEKLAALTSSGRLNYTLSASIGFARCTEELQYIQDLIALADQSLYETKHARPKKHS